MTNKEILTKAINKAIADGWKPIDNLGTFDTTSFTLKTYFHDMAGARRIMTFKDIIYDHQFAKSLWGEDGVLPLYAPYNGGFKIHNWKYHLQQMVIADDAIEYLGKNI